MAIDPADVIPADWGVRPVLFHIGSIPVPSYEVFVGLAIIVGALVYWYEARQKRVGNERTFFIAAAALVGGALGAKLPYWIRYAPDIISHFSDSSYLLAGRSILGGLLGGLIAVKLVKWRLGITERRGNLFAPAAALGLAIGRIGCFLRGCCYGTPTSLPWGVDFGDGILRHPTQLYESAFALLLFFWLQRRKKQNPAPGALFTEFLNSYFVFRFLIEFIRVEPHVFGLSEWQWVCLAGLLYVNHGSITTFLRKIIGKTKNGDKSDVRGSRKVKRARKT
jgi:phosphatidylglycerol---prolipoprotein diacylglyceryl transferase